MESSELSRMAEIEATSKVKENRVPTGIPSFDKIIDGGFNEGDTVLVAGQPGAGNSLIDPDRLGIILIAEDKGPGIANLEKALHGINDFKKGLGVGLSGAKRLMDEFNIESKVGKGTTVIAKKWKSNRPLSKGG